MTSGLEVYDSTGVLIMDTTSRVVKIIGTYSFGSSYTGSAQSGSLNVPLFGANPSNTPVFLRIDGNWAGPDGDAVITISGSTLSWQYQNASTTLYGSTWSNRQDTTIIYGLF